jgi:hypothetical protein
MARGADALKERITAERNIIAAERKSIRQKKDEDGGDRRVDWKFFELLRKESVSLVVELVHLAAPAFSLP